MALKISKGTLTHNSQREKHLQALVDAHPLLQACFRKNHPLLDFKLHGISDSLTFSVRFHGQAEFATGCAHMFTLDNRGQSPSWQNDFLLGYTSVLRALMFCVMGAETEEERGNLVLIKNGGVDWSRVDRFIELAVQALPVGLETRHDDHAQLYIITAPHMHPAQIRINRANFCELYSNRTADEWAANELLRNDLHIQVARVITDALSEQEAQAYIAARESQQSVRDQQAKLPGQTKEEHRSLSDKLMEKLSVTSG